MPKKIFEGLGPGTLVPQRGKLPLDDPRITMEDGFVLSRVDGRTSLEEICLLVPFEEPVTMVILRRLWELGALEVPGVARQLVPPQSERKKEASVAAPLPAAPAGVTDAPPAMAPEARARIDEFFASLDKRNAFQLLEVDPAADAKNVKRAYFKLSKEFHPDRYYGKDIGDYRDKLTKIFQAVKSAFELLSDENRRRAYEESVGLK